VGNTFTDRSTRRIADVVRTVERMPTDLTREPAEVRVVPFEICRFEMTEALTVPQNGPGTGRAWKLRWSPTETHVGLNYDTLNSWTPGAILDATGGISYYETWPATDWRGDYTSDFGDSEVGYHEEPITVVDFLRRHSKPATPDGVVGAYGIAWNPHDGPIDLPNVGSRPVWEILAMQTPDDFYGRLEGNLDTSDASEYVTVFRPDGTTGHQTVGPGGYDYFLAGDSQLVWNPPADWNSGTSSFDGYLFAGETGDVVRCSWNMRESKYYITQIEPNKRGWTGQTVVTDVGPPVVTKTIWSPPYAPPT